MICATPPPTASKPSPSPRIRDRPQPRSGGQGLLRIPRRPDGAQQRGADQDVQPLPRPQRASADILKLRELHAAMDRAVLDAYGWTDLQPTCEFLLDYEEDEDEDEPQRPPPQEALALPLARRIPRRSPGPPPRTQPPPRRAGAADPRPPRPRPRSRKKPRTRGRLTGALLRPGRDRAPPQSPTASIARALNSSPDPLADDGDALGRIPGVGHVLEQVIFESEIHLGFTAQDRLGRGVPVPGA